MPLRLAPFADIPLTEPTLRSLLDAHTADALPRLERYWRYYRNPITHNRDLGAASPRPHLAQEEGLPSRLTSPQPADDRDPGDREIVIENDIAWRLHTLVDFMLAKPITIRSTAQDEQTRLDIQRILTAVLQSSGGIALLQDAALLSSIYGCIDFLLRTTDLFAAPRHANPDNTPNAALDLADKLRIEIVEPPRAVPVLSSADFRTLDAYLIHFTKTVGPTAQTPASTVLAALRARLGSSPAEESPSSILEIFSANHHQLYDHDALVLDEPNPLGVLPVVHIQNLSQPFHYAGLSDVEPLIPLQDELNTRLSDRAHRVTLQSFKLYLAKGLEDDAPIRAITPGQVWSTSNPDASIQSFGADAAAPSEDNHIQQIREAMDKTSAVNPLAAGLIRARVGQLSSENALRITLMGTLAKTARKQIAFGAGLSQLSALVLRALDTAGVYRTDAKDRAVTIHWPDPIAPNEQSKLKTAQLKINLGVPREQVLAELGYTPDTPNQS